MQKAQPAEPILKAADDKGSRSTIQENEVTLPKKAIQEFQDAWFEAFQEHISAEEAEYQAATLLRLHSFFIQHQESGINAAS